MLAEAEATLASAGTRVSSAASHNSRAGRIDAGQAVDTRRVALELQLAVVWAELASAGKSRRAVMYMQWAEYVVVEHVGPEQVAETRRVASELQIVASAFAGNCW